MNHIHENLEGLSNKDKAVAFLQLVSAGNVREAYKIHIADGFSHHNPYFHGDAESLMLAMEEDATTNPNKTLEVMRAIEEGDLVAVHSHVKQNQKDLGVALVHIFRFKDGRIIELWDLAQPIPENVTNEYGVF